MNENVRRKLRTEKRSRRACRGGFFMPGFVRWFDRRTFPKRSVLVT